jgi:cold shock CspA family protein
MPDKLDEVLNQMADELEAGDEKKTAFTYGETLEGKIVKLNTDRGYGFILSDERKFKRFFFHWTALRPEGIGFEEITPGMKVRFVEAYSAEKGPRAVQIEILND